MNKVFRFHEGEVFSGWQETAPLSSQQISQINDPDGLDPIRQITSIPSPFARMDLVLTAFREVVKSGGDLNGRNVFYQLVSDALDIGQIFFNIDICDDVQITAWDKNRDLQNLLSSDNPQHRHFGETLNLFLNQDSDAYNFNRMNRIFILSCKDKNDDTKVLGGTSPCTLFFSSANDLENIYSRPFGGDTVFDKDYRPLYQRDPEFIRFLYALLNNDENKFRDNFSDFANYLDSNYDHLTYELKTEISSMGVGYVERNFIKLDTGIDGDDVEVNGIYLYKNKIDKNRIQSESDFVISSKKYSGFKPLVLPNRRITSQHKYVWENWHTDHTAPFYDAEEDIEKRTLPYIGCEYPYLTVNDFLNPFIVKLDFQLNDSLFYHGNQNDRIPPEERCYLPPIKKEFFRFFDKEHLKKYHDDGKPYFEMSKLAGGTIEVFLRIPIRNGYTTFSRKYESRGSYGIPETPDMELNKGCIVVHSIDLAIFPFVDFIQPGDNPFYRVGLIDRDIQPVRMGNSFCLKFYDQNYPEKELDGINAVRKTKKTGAEAGFDIYALERKFDFIEIEINQGQYRALIIPWFNTENGNDQFTFAVDFGTTYTHIEYRRNNEPPKPLEIDNIKAKMIGKLHHDSAAKSIAPEFREIFDFNMVPDNTISNLKYSLPIRTAIAERSDLERYQTAHALADYNIPFTYEKKPVKRYQRIITELKWENIHGDDRPIKRIEAFAENILMLIKAFTIINQGEISRVKLVWLYPASMVGARRSMLKDVWERHFTSYFPTSNTDPVAVSESTAPYYFFRDTQDASSYDQPAVSIDIGGETTDVVFFSKNNPEMLTSFRFAGNVLFGTFRRTDVRSNGFVKAFYNLIETHLKNFADLSEILNELKESGDSRDVISFFFSLERTTTFSFLRQLENSKDFRIVFILFYIAIIYHVANIFKYKNYELPRHLTFSGTASKLLRIVTPDVTTLRDLTVKIFEMVCNRNYHSDGLDLHIDEKKPKEITCKGALIENNEEDYVNKIKFIHYGVDDSSFPEKKIRYRDIDVQMKTKVLEEYKRFLEFIKDFAAVMDFTDKFDIPQTLVNRHLADLQRDVKSHLNERIAETFDNSEDPEQILEEPLFFLPVSGSLRRLILKIGSEIS